MSPSHPRCLLESPALLAVCANPRILAFRDAHPHPAILASTQSTALPLYNFRIGSYVDEASPTASSVPPRSSLTPSSLPLVSSEPRSITLFPRTLHGTTRFVVSKTRRTANLTRQP